MTPTGQSAPPAAERDRRLTQTLEVLSREGTEVVLAAERSGGCGACALKRGCAASVLGDVLRARAAPLALQSTNPLEPGDRVEVSMAGGAFVQAVFLAFLVPPAALTAALLLGAWAGLPEIARGPFALAAFAVGFLPLRRAEVRGRLRQGLRIEGVTAVNAKKRPLP